MMTLSLAAALFLDRVLGELTRIHPLVAFGELARRVESRTRPGAGLVQESDLSAEQQFRAGATGWSLLVITPTLALVCLLSLIGDVAATVLGIVVLYFCLGMRSLEEHARAVATPLLAGDLVRAREQLSRIVSRDTEELDSQSITRGTVESVLENGSDAVLAPLFWFVLAGAPGALFYRLANTLDAMWGYRNERYLHYGKVAARADDILNWLPARCCALGYALSGNRESALRCWRNQAPQCDSPNAGPVMAAGAGALSIVLGGPASYRGETHWRPVLGEGERAQPGDIEQALQLLWRTTALWLLVILVLEILL